MRVTRRLAIAILAMHSKLTVVMVEMAKGADMSMRMVAVAIAEMTRRAGVPVGMMKKPIVYSV